MRKILLFTFLFISSISHAEWTLKSFNDEITDERSFLIVTQTGEDFSQSALAIRFTPPKLESYPSVKTLFSDDFPKSLFKVIGKPEIALLPAHELFLDNMVLLTIRFGSKKPVRLICTTSSNHKALFLPSIDDIFTLIMISDKVVFRYDHHGTETLSFNTSGLNKILLKILHEIYPESMKNQPVETDDKTKPICQTCKGTQKISKHVECPKCHGSGIYKESRRNGKMSYSIEMPCDKCKDGQMLKTTSCPDCKNRRN